MPFSFSSYARFPLVVLCGVVLTGCSASQRPLEVITSAEDNKLPIVSAESVDQANSRIENHRFASFRYTIVPERLHASAVSKIKKWAEGTLAQPQKAVERNPQVAKVNSLPGLDKTVRTLEQRLYCNRVAKHLNSVKMEDCLKPVYSSTGAKTVQGQSIMATYFGKVTGVKPIGKVLLLGGTHGDELSSASIVFEWANFLRAEHSGEFIWQVVPIVNLDGLLSDQPTRTNANGIDLNRNMPTPDWQNSALKYWREQAGELPRKFPGYRSGSEPETLWLVDEIARFKPDMIISVHAPHNMIDYDAPSRTNAPRRIGQIKAGLLGTYPGSLGSYAGEKRGIPVVTIELPDANKAIGQNELSKMWGDLFAWLVKTIPVENNRFSKERQFAKLDL
ncbi:MAG: protein MpaA [Saprospiraceae bacterium]|jgi:protein MpaA